ncbi:hypothetical protein B0H19DRAFT_1071490 [Mycena capillaripes]|nr:hypothetical protein B0H19DRAFT_1071490 [Mycena capillaripes]
MRDVTELTPPKPGGASIGAAEGRHLASLGVTGVTFTKNREHNVKLSIQREHRSPTGRSLPSEFVHADAEIISGPCAKFPAGLVVLHENRYHPRIGCGTVDKPENRGMLKPKLLTPNKLTCVYICHGCSGQGHRQPGATEQYLNYRGVSIPPIGPGSPNVRLSNGDVTRQLHVLFVLTSFVCAALYRVKAVDSCYIVYVAKHASYTIVSLRAVPSNVIPISESDNDAARLPPPPRSSLSKYSITGWNTCSAVTKSSRLPSVPNAQRHVTRVIQKLDHHRTV